VTRAVAVVTPVFGNAPTLAALARRVEAALAPTEWSWRLRFVVDASPDDSTAVASRLAAADAHGRIAVTDLAVNVGQHRALARGLADEAAADAWVCIDADLQDPPEAIPELLDRLAGGGLDAVFAGRRGRYEGRGRLAGGRLHRALLRSLTGLPGDAGAFVALAPAAREAVVRLQAPSIVAAIGVAGLRVASVPVERAVRATGASAWGAGGRMRQSGRTLAWAVRARVRGQSGAGAGTQRCTSVSV
jgi:glycosyltransferase involved in cell wall biosynthesis